jgi:dTDP-4-dehydrorhamnose 3,5-epimerase
MQFHSTPLQDARIVTLEPRTDERGLFARSFCTREFDAAGLISRMVQCNISYNRFKGTLRGMHFQRSPATEAKLVRCTRGAIYDVIVDLRPESPTYLRHFGVELTADNRTALYVPELFAHGYITLTDDAEVFYQVSGYYTPALEGGLRHDDPAIGITWPTEVRHISDKDAQWPLLSI